MTRDLPDARPSVIRVTKTFASVILLAVALTTSVAAQSAAAIDPHSRALTISLDAGNYPDQFTRPGSNAACGSPPGFGAGVSVVDRPRSAVVLEAELRASVAAQLFQGCDVALVYSPAPGVFSPLGPQPVSGTPVMPLLRTLVHGGLETPRDISPITVRGTVGLGMIWNRHPAPIGALTLGVSNRGPGTRVYAELERDVTRVRETEALFRTDTLGTLVPAGSASQVAHPVWVTLRIGIEMPLR